MSIKIFDIKPKKKKEKQKEINYERFVLVKHEIPAKPSSITYVDIDGIEKNVTSDFYKLSNGSYVMNKVYIEQYPIYETQEISYVYSTRKFSYFDKDGIKREFNNLDSLKYNENDNTYTGLTSYIEYTSTPVEVFIDDK